ncbi:RsmB/NOP family class I SAM-dependent RNA methyltransferase [Pseudoroseicyclus tamaricis]|uniref:RsmB/NOP family class I SAM-dependent RNA methyltransferase n=1 Tax=Pseudoroseicyclus tamaricis TaxID=2705421 RepID=A0A6B2JR57_9RHOB|nr:RsmB/NOP family class I SAM-dependent RNA methyltransferase [Pseudoroseicyclus tamaricis]NDV00658.1 RsmB/NOP family class I SAM-dependent RNA methyltransferase [Pseudoroseicyclus tamaricis]
MTPGARIAAAIDILDAILAGAPAERELTRWARGARYAGSGDRAAVRDHVYDALRCRRSAAHLGGAETGRGLMLGVLRLAGTDPAGLFTGEGHAPAPPDAEESGSPLDEAPPDLRADCPAWLWPRLGPQAEAIMAAQRSRAPVFLRVNSARTTRAAAVAALAEAGVTAEPLEEVETALRVTHGERRIAASAPYQGGLVDLQDAASQAAVLRLPLAEGMRVLDYCAGGGGKALAMGACARLELTAHDADPARMADLSPRAARAGLTVRTLPTEALAAAAPFDLVLVDAPCSGSGTWRRTPEAKWRLTEARLAELTALQTEILGEASRLVAPGGTLAYATCSVLEVENDAQIASFLSTAPGWSAAPPWHHLPGENGDGFFLACLTAP